MAPVITTNSPEDTASLGEMLGRLLQPGDFVALIGDLGAGKTHFVQGVARGLDVPAEVSVTSPSYTLLNEYAGRVPLYHFDLYRLVGDDDIDDLGFQEYFSGTGICLVEWADRLRMQLPGSYLRITILDRGDTCRSIELSGVGGRFVALAAALAARLEKKNLTRASSSC